MTPTQLMEWEAYDRLEPVGDVRRDYMDGQLTALISNLASALYGPKNSTRVERDVEDFIPWAEHKEKSEPGVARTPTEMKALFQGLMEQQKLEKARKQEQEEAENVGLRDNDGIAGS